MKPVNKFLSYRKENQKMMEVKFGEKTVSVPMWGVIIGALVVGDIVSDICKTVSTVAKK